MAKYITSDQVCEMVCNILKLFFINTNIYAKNTAI